MPQPDPMPVPAADPAPVLEQPTAACSYRRNPDGTLTQLDQPTVVPEFAPKE